MSNDPINLADLNRAFYDAYGWSREFRAAHRGTQDVDGAKEADRLHARNSLALERWDTLTTFDKERIVAILNRTFRA